MENGTLHLFDLPEEILEGIFSNFSFQEICQLREICVKFDSIAKRMLKHAFRQFEERLRSYRRDLKLLLPRRESERRKHPLSSRSEVLSAIETRVSLLDMSIMRYAEEGYCAFFAGKVLDELRKIFNVLKRPEPLPRPQEFLHELRDMSSMAMEYFDETLLPRIHLLKGTLPDRRQASFSMARNGPCSSSKNISNSSFSESNQVDSNLYCFAVSTGASKCHPLESLSTLSIPDIAGSFEDANNSPKFYFSDNFVSNDCFCSRFHKKSSSNEITNLVAESNAMRKTVRELCRSQQSQLEYYKRLTMTVAMQSKRLRRLESLFHETKKDELGPLPTSQGLPSCDFLISSTARKRRYPSYGTDSTSAEPSPSSVKLLIHDSRASIPDSSFASGSNR